MKTLNIISLESLAVVATMAVLALVEDDRIGSFDLDI